MKKYIRQFKEEDSDQKSEDAIADLIKLDNVNTDDEKGKFLGLIKGLVWEDSDSSNKFLKAINDFTSGLKAEDFE